MAFMIKERKPDGSLGGFKKVGEGETQKEKEERLEGENAQLIYQTMMMENKYEEMNKYQSEIDRSQADLIYQLMTKGVL